MSPLSRTCRQIAVLLLLCLSLTGCAFGNHMDKGDEFYKNAQYDQALGEYKAALRLKPESAEAKANVKKTQTRITKLYTAAARKKLKDGDYLGAIASTADAQKNAPEPRMVIGLVKEVSSSVQLQSDTMSRKQEYAGALKLLQALYTQIPSQQLLVESKIKGLKETWSEQLIVAAKDAMANKHHGDALLLYTKSSTLIMAPETVAKRDELIAKIRTEHAYTFTLSGNRSNKVFKAIDDAFKKYKWRQNVRWVAKPKKKSKNLPYHTLVSLNLGTVKVSTGKSSSVRSARYQSGTRQVPNSTYKSIADQLARERTEVTRAERKVNDEQSDLAKAQQRYNSDPSSSSAKSSVDSAQRDVEYARTALTRQNEKVRNTQARLNSTPQTIDEAVFANLSYPVTTHTIQAYATYEADAIHYDGRDKLPVKRQLSVRASDSTHQAYPIAKIGADPLRLPSAGTMRAQLYSRAAGLTQQLILQSLQSYRAKMLEKARAANNEGERINLYVMYILLDPSKVNAEVEAEIYAKRGIPNSAKVLAGVKP